MANKISAEEKKKLEAVYGSVGDEINPATGYAAGVGVGDIKKLAEAASGRGGFDDSGSSGGGSVDYRSARGTLSYGSATSDYIARLTDSMNEANSLALRQKYDAMLRALGTSEAAQGAIARETAFLAGLGDIDLGEANARAELENRKYALNADLETELARALAEGETKKYQSLLEQYRIDQEGAYRAGRDAVSDARWQSEFDYKAGRDQTADERYAGEWVYKLAQDAAKKSTGPSSGAASAAKAPAMFEEGVLAGRAVSDFLGTEGSRKPFSNNTQKVSYDQAAAIWSRFYTVGAQAFADTVNLLKSSKASRAVIKAVFDHLPGYAGLNAWYYAIQYGGLEKEYYEI